MNRIPIVLPDLGTPACRLSLWHVQAGEMVHEGDRVAEVQIPGAIIDVAAPVDGHLADRLVMPGDGLSSGQTLGTIEPHEQP